MNHYRPINVSLKFNSSYCRLLILLTLQRPFKRKIVNDLQQQNDQFILPFKKILAKAPIKDFEKMTYLFSAPIDGMILRLLYMAYEYSLEELFEFYMEQFKLKKY